MNVTFQESFQHNQLDKKGLEIFPAINNFEDMNELDDNGVEIFPAISNFDDLNEFENDNCITTSTISIIDKYIYLLTKNSMCWCLSGSNLTVFSGFKNSHGSLYLQFTKYYLIIN